MSSDDDNIRTSMRSDKKLPQTSHKHMHIRCADVQTHVRRGHTVNTRKRQRKRETGDNSSVSRAIRPGQEMPQNGATWQGMACVADNSMCGDALRKENELKVRISTLQNDGQEGAGIATATLVVRLCPRGVPERHAHPRLVEETRGASAQSQISPPKKNKL